MYFPSAHLKPSSFSAQELETWADKMMTSWSKKVYFGFGKPWKATILRRVVSAESVVGVRKDIDLSSLVVKVALESS